MADPAKGTIYQESVANVLVSKMLEIIWTIRLTGEGVSMDTIGRQLFKQVNTVYQYMLSYNCIPGLL